MARILRQAQDGQRQAQDGQPEPSASSGEGASGVAAMAAAVKSNIGRVLVGKESVIELTLTALLSGGHILVEDVPGIGKTTLARSLAESLRCSFRRIQCTPDLMPSDITGVHYYNQKLGEFEFRPGPILAQVVLADEINRATPRTQSALLEAMAEGQVTVDDRTLPLPAPFVLVATQNPIELEGTFPLPEAQLDRFMLRLRLGYPDETDEEQMLARFNSANPIDAMQPVAGGDDIVGSQEQVRDVYVDPVLSNLHRPVGSGNPAARRRGAWSQPAGHARALSLFPGVRRHPGPQLRHARRREGFSPLRSFPSHHPHAAGPAAGPHCRRRRNGTAVTSRGPGLVPSPNGRGSE